MHGLPLRTPLLTLRHFSFADAEGIFRLNAEPSTSHWLPTHVYPDTVTAIQALQYLIDAYFTPGHPKQGPYVLALERSDTGNLIGHVGFSPLDGIVEVSYAVAEASRGLGFGAEALKAASEWARFTFQLPRLVAITATSNTPSRRTLSRANYIHVYDEVRLFQGAQQSVSHYIWSSHDTSSEA